MKKILLLIFASALVFNTVYSQSLPTIEVEGNSELMIVPDQAAINITVQKKAMSVAEATKVLNAETKTLIDAFKNSSLDYDLTANNYYVNVNRIYYKSTSKDSGYVASQNINVTIKNIKKDLPTAVELVSTNGDHSMNVNFIISKEMEKTYKERLLELALTDAQQKAKKIADVMDLNSIVVHNVQYVSTQAMPKHYQMRVSGMMDNSAESREAPSFMPEEQSVSDKVLITFIFEP